MPADEGPTARETAPGHTPGSVVIFLALPGGRRYALVGDLVWQLEGIREREERPLLWRTLADVDHAAVRENILRMAAVAESFPDLVIVPAHDPRGFAGVPTLVGHRVHARRVGRPEEIAKAILFLCDSRGGSTLIIAGSRQRADATYVLSFGADEMREEFASELAYRAWAAILCDDDFPTEAVVYYPDDVDLPEDDIDNEDVGFAVIAGSHTADEWRLYHGMLMCPCEVCRTCGGWFTHAESCPNRLHAIREGDCCERAITVEAATADWKGQPLEIEWVPAGRRPVWFAAGWRHPRFDDDGWSLLVERPG